MIAKNRIKIITDTLVEHSSEHKDLIETRTKLLDFINEKLEEKTTEDLKYIEKLMPERALEKTTFIRLRGILRPEQVKLGLESAADLNVLSDRIVTDIPVFDTISGNLTTKEARDFIKLVNKIAELIKKEETLISSIKNIVESPLLSSEVISDIYNKIHKLYETR